MEALWPMNAILFSNFYYHTSRPEAIFYRGKLGFDLCRIRGYTPPSSSKNPNAGNRFLWLWELGFGLRRESCWHTPSGWTSLPCWETVEDSRGDRLARETAARWLTPTMFNAQTSIERTYNATAKTVQTVHSIYL